MSVRAVFVRAKQIIGEILRRRIPVHVFGGKHNPKVKGRPQDFQSAQGVAEPYLPRSLLRSFVGYRASHQSTAVGLRRNAALRLIEFRYHGYARRSGGREGQGSSRWGRSGNHLPVYAFLGLTLAAGERGLLGGKGEDEENEMKMRLPWLPLETCCNIIRDTFKRPDPNLESSRAVSFPSDIASYEISNQLLGKGTSASIYAVRLIPSPPTEDAVSETISDDEEADENEAEGEDWSMVSDDEGHHQEDLSLESWDGISDLEDGIKEDPGDKEDFDLALKMMFNYDIASNATAIYQAFEREFLPLWPTLDNGAFGMVHVRWENGNRAKKKTRPFLPSHPNIAEVHHAFIGPTVAHNIEEARTLFPAALPARLHVDGMGRNQTMYLVMKRYDMTLAEFNQAIGCQSQHVAMVIVAQLLEGVSHLVQHGIAHRDLKSNNILIELSTGSPRVVIADFGCCLADGSVGLHLPYPTRYTEIGGNSALMAPEVKLSIPSPMVTIDYTKADAWAVGAIAYEILGLPNPFYRHSNGRLGLDSGQYKDDDLPGLPDNVNPGLAKTIGLLLKKDPVMRPTASVAANILHLLLWQPPVFIFASWEGSRQMPAPAVSSRQQQLATWLLQLSAGLLCQRSFRSQLEINLGGHRSWLDDTEYQLCMAFMARVTPNDLLTAANHLLP